MAHQKPNHGADWKRQLTSAEAAELDAIERRVAEIDDERQRLTDRRRRIYDRGRRRQPVSGEIAAA